jgi:hypothetical protein
VVPESPTAQDSPAEEQQQPKDQDVEDKANEEYPPRSDTEDEKMYQDADEVDSFEVEAPVPADRLRALLEHLGITTAPRNRIKEVPCSGRVEFKAIAEIFFRIQSPLPTQGTSFQDLSQRCCCQCRLVGHHIVGLKQQASVVELCPLPPSLQEEGSIQGLRGEEEYPQDGDGTPPGCDGRAEHSSTSRSARDRDSLHPALERRRHHPRLHEDGRGSDQRPLCVRHRHLDSHLLCPEFRQGARSH